MSSEHRENSYTHLMRESLIKFSCFCLWLNPTTLVVPVGSRRQIQAQHPQQLPGLDFLFMEQLPELSALHGKLGEQHWCLPKSSV